MMATATEEAASVVAWFAFYTRLYEDETHVARPSHTLLQLLQSAFPVLYEEIVERRLMLGSDEWTCVIVVLDAFYEVELGIDRSTLKDAMTFEDASLHSTCIGILEFVVSALVQSDSKARFVGDIMTMDDSVQVDIMAVIERVLKHTASLAGIRASGEDDVENMDDPTLRESCSEGNAYGTPTRSMSGRTSSSSSPTGETSRSPLHLATKAEMERLQRANDILKEDNVHIAKELEEIRLKLDQAQAENITLMQTIQSIKVQSEMDILKKERSVRSYFDNRIHVLQRELDRVTSELEEKTAIAKEVNELRDEIDLLRPSADRLAKAESTLAKYKTKIEDLAAVNEKLRRTEDANADLVEKNLALENQAAKATMLQRKLADSKEANTTIQFHVSELETKLSRLTAELEAKRVECDSISTALLEQKSLNSQLQLAVDEIDAKGVFPSAGTESVGGIGELNPELMEKLARLEHENSTLKSQIDGTTSDRIDSLLDDIDDLKRMKKSFETKYFDTTEVLKETQAKLSAAQDTVLSLQEDLGKRTRELTETTAVRDNLNRTLDTANQKILELTDLDVTNKLEIDRRVNLEEHLNEEIGLRNTEISSLQLTLIQTVQQLQHSTERNDRLCEDVTSYQRERQDLVAYRDELQSNLHELEAVRSSLVDQIADLENDRECLRRELGDAGKKIMILHESGSQFAMRCEELYGVLLTKTEDINRHTAAILKMTERTEGLENDLLELVTVRQSHEARIQLLVKQLHVVEEELAAVETKKAKLMEDVEHLQAEVSKQHDELRQSRETVIATVEDYEHRLLRFEEHKQQELSTLAYSHETQLQGAANDQARLIADHEIALDELAQDKADLITRMTSMIDEKCILLQEAKEEMIALQEKHECAMEELRSVLQQEKKTIESQKNTVAAEFTQYVANHSFSDEDVRSREATLQEKLSQLSAMLDEEKSKLGQQRDALNDQVMRLHEANRDMKTRFESQEAKLREAVKSQLETNRKLVEINQSIKNELVKKEAQVVQLENAATRLDSRIRMFERERTLYSPEDGIKREAKDSSSSYSSQLNSITQITEELDLLRKENKKLQEQLSRRIDDHSDDHDDSAQQSTKNYFLERIRQLELAKAHEEDKKRELLLVNAKLIQDHKQIQIRNACDSKELLVLKEKVNTWMLRDERRKKEHEVFAQRVRDLESENHRLRSKLETNLSEDMPTLESQSSEEPFEVEPPVQFKSNEDQENIPPTDNISNDTDQENAPSNENRSSPTVMQKKRKIDCVSKHDEVPESDDLHQAIASGLSVIPHHPADEKEELLTPAPPTTSIGRPRAKRRMSVFISNRLASGATTAVPQEDEKPSECQQQ